MSARLHYRKEMAFSALLGRDCLSGLLKNKVFQNPLECMALYSCKDIRNSAFLCEERVSLVSR